MYWQMLETCVSLNFVPSTCLTTSLDLGHSRKIMKYFNVLWIWIELKLDKLLDKKVQNFLHCKLDWLKVMDIDLEMFRKNKE